MKRLLHNSIAALVLLCSTAAAHAVDLIEETKMVNKSFAVTANSEIEIENKHGDIYIELWDKDSISFEIEIKAYAEKLHHLPELLEMVDIEFNAYSSFVIAKTQWAEGKSVWDKTKLAVGRSIAGTKELRINYKIKMPDNLALSIANEFGDVFLPDFRGKIECELSHGDIRARRLYQIDQIVLSHGNIKLKYGEGGRLDFSYVQDAELEELKGTYIKSSSSELDIEKMDNLSIDSRYDSFFIEEIGSISGNSVFSKITVRKLNEKADLRSKYGRVNMESLSSTASLIKLQGTNTDYFLGFDAFAAGKFDLQLTNVRGFEHDTNMVFIVEQNSSGEKQERIAGTIGEDLGQLDIQLIAKNATVSLGR